mgnify:CR=1 FL=1
MKEKVTKKLETNVAELIVVSLFLAVFLSSCAQTYSPCAAYANVEVKNEMKWRN